MVEQPSPCAEDASRARLTIISGGQTGVDMAALLAAEQYLSHRLPPSRNDVQTCDLDPTARLHTVELRVAGYVPRHYTNETGAYGIPERFRPFLTETASVESRERTERNIAQSDGILTLSFSSSESLDTMAPAGAVLAVSAGTQLGIEYAASLGKAQEQLLFIELGPETEYDANAEKTVRWLRDRRVERCAIGGPRESEAPGIQNKAEAFLCAVFAQYLDV